jgi:phage terminase large subunit
MEITLKPDPKQDQAYQALENKEIDTVFLGGGAGGGKSWWICESRLINALRFPGYKSFIGREELKRLMQSTYITFTKVCQWHKIPQKTWKLNGQYNYIEFQNGSRIDLLDLKYLPTDPLYERFGSLEYTDGAIEEAGEVHFLAYDVLKTRIGRHKNKELGIHPVMAITGNPKKNWTYSLFYKPYRDNVLPKSIAYIKALYTDNSYTAEEYGKQLQQISDKATKQRLMFGNWEYDDDPAALIRYENIVDLFTNTVESSDEKFITADIARFGRDKTVIKVWNGLECYLIKTFTKQGLDVTAEEIKKLERDEGVPRSHVLIDEDGVGGGVLDMLPGAKGFIANSVPISLKYDKENYQNLKSQCTYLLADYVNNHKLSIKNCEQTTKDLIISELEQIKSKDADKDGKRKVIGKDEIKEVLGHSPDYADNLMMRMYFELKKISIEKYDPTPSYYIA